MIIKIFKVYIFCMMIDKVIGHIKEKIGSKYLVFDSMELHSTNENKEILKKKIQIALEWD